MNSANLDHHCCSKFAQHRGVSRILLNLHFAATTLGSVSVVYANTATLLSHWKSICLCTCLACYAGSIADLTCAAFYVRSFFLRRISAERLQSSCHALPGYLCREYHGHKKKVHSINWNCLGTKLASGSVDMSVRVWAVEELGRTAEMELKGHTGSVDQLRWDPKQSWLLGSASGDKTVRIWDTRTGKCAQAIETRGENINIRWSPNGQHISVGDKDDNISLIDMRKCVERSPLLAPWRLLLNRSGARGLACSCEAHGRTVHPSG
eukprot:5010212-Pleurochrysis_carterae.AAC.2